MHNAISRPPCDDHDGGGAAGERAHMVVVAAWSLFLAVLFLFAASVLVRVPGFDPSIYLYIAAGLLEGELPYLDRWDHKPPLIFLINVVALLLSDVWGTWLVQIGVLTGTCLAAYGLMKANFGSIPTLFATTVLLVYFPKLVEGGNTPEQYALPLQFAALSLFVAAEEGGSPGGRRRHTLVFLGCAGGAALMLRPNLVGVWLAIGLYWLVYRNDVARKFGWAAVGGVAVLLCFVVWLLLAGGPAMLAAFWDAAFVYNVYYSDASLGHKFLAARQGFQHLHPIAWLLVIAWSIGLWRMLAGAPHGAVPTLMRLAVVLLPIEVAATGISGYRFGHYYLTLIPMACILSAYALDQLLGTFGRQLPWLPVAVFAAIALIWTTELQANRVYRDPLPSGDLRQLIEQIKQLSEAGDPILIWGEPVPLLAADRSAPTRYFSPLSLMRGNRSNKRIEEFTTDVKANPPVLIVDMHRTFLPPLAATDAVRRGWRDAGGRGSYDYQSFRAFYEFMDSNYALVKTTETVGPDIYRRSTH